MSDVASLDLSRKLFELSGWRVANWYIKLNNDPDAHVELLSDYDDRPSLTEFEKLSPAYDAGYLLRKLPIEHKDWGITLRPNVARTLWICGYKSDHNLDVTGKTPEDALCSLAIQMFKAGILPISRRNL